MALEISHDYIRKISDTSGIAPRSIRNTVELLVGGATIPFIARYRKEMTGSLDELQIAEVQKLWQELEELDKRRAYILGVIEDQGRLTKELAGAIRQASELTTLEDLYLPYKQKRKTRAMKAREKGLEPLARRLLKQKSGSVVQWAEVYLKREVPDVETALQGARDIIAEWVSEDRGTRRLLRRHFKKSARIYTRLVRGKEKKGLKFRDYFKYDEALKSIPSHRLLAMLRGESEGILRVRIAPEDEEATRFELQRKFVEEKNEAARQVADAVEDSYKRLLQPSIETEFRNQAKERADEEAIQVFNTNLRQLLLAPPLGPRRVMAVDPGFRTGCKLACLDESGRLLEYANIFPHPPVQEVDRSRRTILELAHKHEVEAVAVGSGTAGKETMRLFRSIDFSRQVEIFMVNENGASIYSASDVARAEFPDLDVTVRGAISIGRRLMDPLAELVKIDPKSIGVGQYQHDVNQTKLRENLKRVVESCVNAVGINLNTASRHLLTYISGLGPTLAGNMVAYREENGLFKSRRELKKVPRLGAKAFEQCAGFLRIRRGEHPLDNTGVHPESYPLVEQMAADLNCEVEDFIRDGNLRKKIKLKAYLSEKVGLPTLQDILKELARPGLDPRGKALAFHFAEGINDMTDLKPGMCLPGIITNITNFGAFVDIGLKNDGLVHISELRDEFVNNPADVVNLHQEVQVRVLDLDVERKRIYLSMKSE